MQRLFPGSLINCIRDGRPPHPNEVANLSIKLWDEGLSYWAPDRPDLAIALAEIALSGCNQNATRKERHQRSWVAACPNSNQFGDFKSGRR